MANPVEVFCCFAREDREMLVLLKKYLAPLQKTDQIVIWELNEGAGWEKDFDQHLESAQIILLLISPDFLAADYCYSFQMKQAIQRHEQGSAVVLPILLRPTHWINMPFAHLRMLPLNCCPITTWSVRDEAFLDILKEIERIVTGLQIR